MPLLTRILATKELTGIINLFRRSAQEGDCCNFGDSISNLGCDLRVIILLCCNVGHSMDALLAEALVKCLYISWYT